MNYPVRFCLCLALGLGDNLLLGTSASAEPATDSIARIRSDIEEITVRGDRVAPDLLPRLNVMALQQNTTDLAAIDYEVQLALLNPAARSGYLVEVNAPAIAGQKTLLKQIYQVAAPITPGGGFMLVPHWQHLVVLQTEDSTRANHVSISTNNPSAEFETLIETRTGIHGGNEGIAEAPFFRLKSGALEPGDLVTIDLGGEAGLELPEMSLPSFEIPLYVKFEASAPFVYIPAGSSGEFPVLPGPLVKLKLIASSLVGVSAPVKLTLRLEDEFGNLARGQSLSLDLLVNGVLSRQVSIEGNVATIGDLSFDVPGVYRVEVRSAGGGLRASSNPILVQAQTQYELLWANLRQHSNRSDGLLDPGAIATQSSGKYDLRVQSDHQEYLLSIPITGAGNITIRESSKSPLYGGARLRLQRNPMDIITMALPESPTDLRSIGRDEPLRLAEIVSGNSVYEWFGNTIAAQGHRVGFTGSNHSHQFPQGASDVHTAILRAGNESWFDALRAGRTYVTTDTRVIILATMNGLPVGSRIPVSGKREFKARIISDEVITSLELIKNGRVIKSFDSSPDAEFWVEMSLYSSSEPYSELFSKPRNAREWVGYIISRETEMRLPPPSLQSKNVRLQATSNRIDFLTRTHGRSQSVIFGLENPGPDTILKVGLASGYEDTAWLPTDRLPAATSGSTIQVQFAQFSRIHSEHVIETKGYTDKISFRLIPRDASLSRSITFTDSSPARLGDYYYLRVSLGNGGMAFTSPIHVGGFDHL